MASNNLQNLKLRQHYDPVRDGTDLVNDFYIPCLSVSCRYDRMSAYFNSAVLKQFCSGLHKFFENQGKIRFIFSCAIDEREMENIKNAYENKVAKMDQISENLDRDKASLMTDYEVSNLAYLIECGLAEVKIAFILDDKSSICHKKQGMFEDKDGNKIFFDGSGNETVPGTMRNAENYTIFDNFSDERGKEEVKHGDETFEAMWNNTYSSSMYTDYPVGKLFEELTSFSKQQCFDSEKSFFEYLNCVVIDYNEEENTIILKDYTSNHALENTRILAYRLNSKWSVIDRNSGIYQVSKPTFRTVNDTIIPRLNQYRIKHLLTDAAQKFLDTHNLELERRNNLGLAIKLDNNRDLWYTNYLRFKEIVDSNTETHLKDMQMLDAFYHSKMIASANYSVPGTGKTYISYGLYAYLSSREVNAVRSLVVFGPLNCFKAWKEEASKIFGSKRHLSIFDVTEHRDFDDFESTLRQTRFDVYIFNYDILNQDSIRVTQRKNIIQKYVFNDNCLLVFDEVHKLKSLVGSTAKNFLDLLNNAPHPPTYRLVLTGTPLPNSFTDLYNPMKLLYGDEVEGTYELNTHDLLLADDDTALANKIREKVYCTFVRTTKEDLEIPLPEPDDYESLCVTPTEDELELYELIWKSYKSPLVQFIRLIQAASNPSLITKSIEKSEITDLFDPDNPIDIFKPGDDVTEWIFHSEEQKRLVDKIGIASKTRKTIDFVIKKAKEGKKVLVWCLFRGTMEFLRHELEKSGISAITIYGVDDISTRNEKIDKFKYDDVQVLITNPNTLAESVSLHMQCHDAVYLEYGFNLTYMLQSKDRINRVGLPPETKTYYYYAISESQGNRPGSIDEYILERLNMKAERMLSTVEPHDLSVISDHSTMADDIEYILNSAKIKV